MRASSRCLVLVVVLVLSAGSGFAADLGTLLQRARAERVAGRYDAALAAYEEMLTIVQTHETALFEHAETLSWAGRFPESLEEFRAFSGLYPARQQETELRIAQVQAWSDEYDAAERTLAPWIAHGDRRALLDSALYLAWGSHLKESIQRLSGWLAEHRDDQEALALRARVASWAGDLRAARADWEALLIENPEVLESKLGLIRLCLWDGDPVAAQRRFDALGQQALGRPEVATLAAQLEIATGRPSKARQRLRSLVQPGNPARNDAIGLLADLADSHGPWIETAYQRTETSDGLTSADPVARLRVPLREGYVDLGWSSHDIAVGRTNANPFTLQAAGGLPLGSRVVLNGGMMRTSAVAGDPAWGGSLGVDLNASPQFNLSAGWSRSYADFTPAALALRTAITGLDVSGSFSFGAGASVVRAAAGRQALSAGSQRTSALLAYEQRWSVAALKLRAGALVRRFGYSETLPLGFFNPEEYHYGGLTAGGRYAGKARWDLSCDAHAGWQSVNGGDRQFAWGYAIGAGWSSHLRRVSIYATWSSSVAGLPVTDVADPAAYRDQTLRIAARFRGK